MMNWHIVTSSEYALGTPVAEDIYFLSDTKEIYRGTVQFSESVILYTTEPTVKTTNRLYINSTTLEGKVWTGTAWSVVIQATASAVTANGTAPISGKAATDYVAAELTKFAASANVVKGLKWEPTEHLLSAVKGDGTDTTPIALTGLGVGLLSTPDASGKSTSIQLTDATGAKIGTAINLDLERFVTSATYDAKTKSIILVFDGKPVETSTDKITIPVGDLVDTYTVVDSNSVDLTMTGTEIKADVKVSATAKNTITVKTDGLYVPEVDTSTFMDLVPGAVAENVAKLDASGQVTDSGVAISKIHETKVFTGASISEAVGASTPLVGDICIVKAQIGTSTKYSYTAYVYTTVWEPMDGNYDAENVYFAQDLITTSAIGNISLSNGQATIAAAGKNLKEVFNTIFVSEKNPNITQPSVGISSNLNSVEVGTVFTPTYTATLNGGSYQYGPATGITATTWTVTDNAAHTRATNAGSFDAFTVADDTNYTISASAAYGAGTVPVTNVGNTYAAGQIKAGNASRTYGNSVRGFRSGFYGTTVNKTDVINSAFVRGLAVATNAAPSAGNTWDLVVPVGAMRVVFAYPATIRDVNSVLDVNGLNAEIKSAFTKTVVDVEGLNSYTAIGYKVYVLEFANANDKANHYTVKL